MKNLTLSSIAFSLLLFAGCAGITDANLSDVQSSEAEVNPISNHADFQRSDRKKEKDADPIIFGGDQEDIIVVRPTEDDDRD